MTRTTRITGDPGPPRLPALIQPLGDDLRGAAVDLRQQPLVPVMSTRPVSKRSAQLRLPVSGAGFPLPFAPASLVDAQHPHLVRFGGQHRIRGHHDESLDNSPTDRNDCQ